MHAKWRYFLSEYGVLAFAALFFVGASAVYFAMTRPDPHVHAGYLPATVLQTFDVTDEQGFRMRAIVRLPDGAQATVVTDSLAHAQELVCDTCLERRTRTSGSVFYRLAVSSNCRD